MSEKRETVRCEIQQGIAQVVINRPEALNALNNQVIRELEKSLSDKDRW
jgi:enoyl-CoA hydratase/carnithine racemase